MDSPKGLVVRTRSTPVMLMQPEMTSSPASAWRGTDSPVRAAVSSCVVPSRMTPSMGTRSPGLTTMTSPTATSVSYTHLDVYKRQVEVMEYPRADRAMITWTEDGRREEVRAGEEAYALCYEMADLERAAAGDEAAAGLIDVAADVMDLMTRLRREWGVTYPEEL